MHHETEPAGDLPEGCPIPDGVADIGHVLIDESGDLYVKLTAPGEGPLEDRQGVVWVTGVMLHITPSVPAWILESWAGVLNLVMESMREQAAVRREQGL